jgi:peptidyl-prolyl cis-trans isomerase B (cyclophilin B)
MDNWTKKPPAAAFLALLIFIFAAACAPSPAEDAAKPAAPEAAPKADPAQDEVAVIETDFGIMVLEFLPEIAPNHVAQFKKLAKEGFYDNTAFHRIVKGFMIQGGDPATKAGGAGQPAPRLKAEFNARPHLRGALSAARTNDPNSATSQFFLCLDPAPFLDRKYTNYGQLVAGEEVLLKIGDVKTKPNPGMVGENSVPEERVNMKKVTIVPRADGLKQAEAAGSKPVAK